MVGAGEIRHAATVILVRDVARAPAILMGQRGANAAFMAKKFVFPGGAVDPGDGAVPLAGGLSETCAARLAEEPRGAAPGALAAAAIRELWEETGLILGRPGTWPDAPADWAGFAEAGFQPDPSALRFVFRAITPPGRPRRFDARFFLADAAAVAGDVEGFRGASGELSHLRWVPLGEARDLGLPFITEVVLAEVAARLPALEAPDTVPFFRNTEEESLFRRLGGRAL